MSRISVILYNQEGETQQGLNPATIASQVEIAAEDGSASNVETEIELLRQLIAVLQNNGVAFKGALTRSAGLPTVNYKAGWQYVVQEAGTYAGKEAEVGDFYIAIRDYASGSASDADWTVLQVNIVGAVTGPASSVAKHVAVFDGTSGKIIMDSGFTIAASVPADAKFTDTTYLPATVVTDGLLTATLFAKLQSIEAGADVTDAINVAAAGAFMTATDDSDDITEGVVHLFMTLDERAKLKGITAGAEPNQNAFTTVLVNGSASLTATSKTDTLKLVSGEGVTVTVDETARTITFSETYRDVALVSSLDDVPANIRQGGLIILRSS